MTKEVKYKNPILSGLISWIFFLHLLYLGKRERFAIVNILFFGAVLGGDPIWGSYMLMASIFSSVPLTMMYNAGKL